MSIFLCLVRTTLIVAVIAAPAVKSPAQSVKQCRSGAYPKLTFSESSIFPKDLSLRRPEDGKVLPDGRLLVADEEHGLRLVNVDGTSRPFGRFADAGFRYSPPDSVPAPNGVFLEKEGRHLLVADVYQGRIYRVDAKEEKTALIYSHPYGINSVVRDSGGNVWFTQSAVNESAAGHLTLYDAIDRPLPTGAVYFLEMKEDMPVLPARRVAEGLYFANGLAFSPDERKLYVAETMMDRIRVYDAGISKGILSKPSTFAYVTTPDNLAVDVKGNLWAASPMRNSVIAIDSECGSVHTVFSAPSENNSRMQDRWVEEANLGKPLMRLFTPELFDPLPGGLVTGMFFSADRKTLYISGLGSALLRFELN